MFERKIKAFFCLLSLTLLFLLCGCAETARTMRPKLVLFGATRNAPCVPPNNLAFEAHAAALLICTDKNGAGLIWQEAPIAGKGEEGKACPVFAALGRDAEGTILFCGDDPETETQP